MKDLVSVIIRTCNRPDVLRNALNSVKAQTYKNVEVIVVEDGKNMSESLIASDFFDLPVKYKAVGEKSGRTKVGNIGLEMATGQYFNFLDDDDILYPNHIETLLKSLTENVSYMAAYSIAEESQIIKGPGEKAKEKRVTIRYKQPFNRLLLYSFNYLPIQSVLFNRCLYDRYGGFDESLDVLEDWDLWVRYSVNSDFFFVPKVTSRYFVPYRGKNKAKRNTDFDKALKQLYNKFETYNFVTTPNKIHADMDYVLNVYNQKRIIYYLKMVWNYFVYGER